MMDNTPNADYDARNRAACDLLTQAVRTMVPDADQLFVDDALEAMLETIYEEKGVCWISRTATSCASIPTMPPGWR